MYFLTAGLRVRYRHYDASGIEPLVAFGHGLAYTGFYYSDLEAPERIAAGDNCRVSLEIANTGEMSAFEVVQLYVHAEDSAIEKAPQELRAFEKIELGGHHKGRIEFELDARAFAHWDEATSAWKVEPGRYEIRVGASSRDIRSRAVVEVAG